MGRKKLPKNELKDVLGISVVPPVRDRLEQIGRYWGVTKASVVGRELLLLALAMVDGLEKQGIFLPFQDLTKAFRHYTCNDASHHLTAQTAINTPLQPPMNPPERPAIDTISTLLAELCAAEKAPDTEAQAEKAALLRSLIQIVREEEKRMTGNDCANPLKNHDPSPSQHPLPKPDPGH